LRKKGRKASKDLEKREIGNLYKRGLAAEKGVISGVGKMVSLAGKGIKKNRTARKALT